MRKGPTVTIDELEADLDFVAELIGQGRKSLLPIYERLEEELENLKKRQSALDRAQRRASGLTQRHAVPKAA
jgi:hypothetical protein